MGPLAHDIAAATGLDVRGMAWLTLRPMLLMGLAPGADRRCSSAWARATCCWARWPCWLRAWRCAPGRGL
ncbi:hypothetical protein B2J89_15750, partial [Acidovorax sp. SRB_24]|nr:hypothetical protein [Acidovorax sp. SRB_24]